jgi:hypothetical protein
VEQVVEVVRPADGWRCLADHRRMARCAMVGAVLPPGRRVLLVRGGRLRAALPDQRCGEGGGGQRRESAEQPPTG